ncbi:MAG TPA: NADH-quinone oxidoreductase subunit L [Bacillota bacterium]|nr:NADH-quinone oxidoreductase subunit L [Bacillota bacterium]HPZ11803.1 NADH-quinone oxidoreductase subunit L [Bacillota bacterium]HQE10020.1 NADH-quinone oxidoreductase subunit L [Bacillota bacterium]
MNSSIYLAQVAVPIGGAVLTLLVGALKPKLRPAFAITAGAATACLTILTLLGAGSPGRFVIPWQGVLNDFSLAPDGLSAYIAAVAGVLGALILLYSYKYMEREEGLTRYYSLVLLFIGAMIGLVTTDNLLVMFFFWETVGLCSYALIGFELHNPEAAKAGLKAFITTKIGDVGLLTGIMVLYVSTGTFNVFEIMEKAAAGELPGLMLALAGFGFLMGAVGKSAQVPLHVWLPDAMEAPTSVSALIHAATMVNAGVYLMARTYPLFAPVAGWTDAVTWVGAGTAFLAACMALFARDLKRMLAYSTVSQLGYMMFGIGVGGILASQFHLLSHAIFKALLFLCAGAVIHEVHTRDMGEMGGVGRRMPVTGRCYLVGVLALAGVPIFNGFWSKDMLFASALHSGNIVPLVLAVITAALTVTYSVRSYIRVFTGEPAPSTAQAKEAHPSMLFPLVLLAAGALTSWLIIGNYSAGLSRSGIIHEIIGVAALISETVHSTAFLLSLAALVLGGLVVIATRKAGMAGEPSAFAAWAGRGFGFDAFYQALLNGAYAAASWIVAVYDRFTDWIGRMIISLSVGFGRALREQNIGDLNKNLLWLVSGIVIVIAIVWAKRG